MFCPLFRLNKQIPTSADAKAAVITSNIPNFFRITRKNRASQHDLPEVCEIKLNGYCRSLTAFFLGFFELGFGIGETESYRGDPVTV